MLIYERDELGSSSAGYEKKIDLGERLSRQREQVITCSQAGQPGRMTNASTQLPWESAATLIGSPSRTANVGIGVSVGLAANPGRTTPHRPTASKSAACNSHRIDLAGNLVVPIERTIRP